MATSPQTNRTIMFAILCIGVFVLAIVAISQNRDASTTPLGEGIVRLGDVPIAEVNGTVIYMSDVRSVAQARNPDVDMSGLPPNDPEFIDVLDELIDQRLMALEALSMSLDQQAEAKRRLAQANERILGNVLVENHLQTRVNEETARQIYDAQAGLRNRGIEVRARQILLSDEASAKLIVDRLEAGEDFSTLALAFSTDRVSRDNGGDLGYFTRDMLGPELTRRAFNADIGERVPIFRSNQGWHVLEVLGRRRAPEPTFEDVKEDIISRMTYDEIRTLLDGLRNKAAIERLSQFSPPEDTAQDE